jgi:CBS domain-containing protein
MSALEQKKFIAKIPPFDRLSQAELEQVAAALDIEYFKPGQVILAPGHEAQYLYLVIKGIVEERGPDGGLVLHESEDSFGGLALLNGVCRGEFTVREECLCHLLPKQVFLEIAGANPGVANFYYQSLSARLDRLIEQRDTRELASFMAAKIRDIYLQPPVMVEATDSIFRAVQILEQHKASSVLVRRGEETGIVTDTDIREHVVLQRKSVDSPVGEIASYSLRGMQREDFLFNALLQMTRHSVKRLVIYEQERIVGMLNQIDLLSYFSHHSHLISVQIEQATSLAQLKKASRAIFEVIQTLYAKGMKIQAITQLVNELNRKVYRKLFHLLAPPELADNACLLVLGSEGRGEQIFKTDQDNALILRDGFALPGLGRFVESFTAALVDFGYPPCPGQVMLSNPEWLEPLAKFQERIYRWLDSPTETAQMHLAIFYDATPVAGDSALFEQARAYLFARLSDQQAYFTRFAKAALSFDTPLGWFAQLVVDKKHGDGLDLKKGGIFPIVHGIRSLALQQRLTCSNTLERIAELARLGVLSREFAEELSESLAFMLNLRLHSELEQIRRNGLVRDNYIQPNRLHKLERDLLRDCRGVVNKFKDFLGYHFRLHLGT